MPAPTPQSQSTQKSPHIGKANGASSIPSPTFPQRADGPRKDTALGSILRSGGAQAKVKIGSATDPAEAEADRVAKQVMSAAPEKEKRKPDINKADASIKRKSVSPKITDKIKEETPPKIQKMVSSPKTPSRATKEADSHAQAALDNLGPGAPLPASEKQFFEPRFDQDFSNVRIHNDAASDTAARAIDARAFAMGNQIAFARGEYSPGTQSGRTLMAHELTHTVQQGGGAAQVQGKFVQRESSGSTESIESRETIEGKGTEKEPYQLKSLIGVQLILPKDKNPGKLIVPEIKVPLKKEAGKGKGAYKTIEDATSFTYTGHLKSKSASTLWQKFSKKAMSADIIAKKIKEIETGPQETIQEGSDIYALKVPDGNEFIFGTATEIVTNKLLRKPNWNESGEIQDGFDVDHIHERQLGGSHNWENFWMIPDEPNREFGARTRKEIKHKVIEPIEKFNKHDEVGKNKNRPQKNDFLKPGKKKWSVEFRTVTDETNPKVTDEESWTREEITNLEPLDALEFMTRKDAEKLGIGTKKKVLMTHKWGGYPHVLNKKSKDASYNRELYKGFYLKNASFEGDAKLKGDIFRNQTNKYATTEKKEITIRVLKREDGLFYYLDLPKLRDTIRTIPLSLNAASPVVFSEGGVSPSGEIYADGEVTATKLLFPNFKFPITFRGDAIYIDVPLTYDDLSLGIVSVTDTSLRIGFDKNGLLLLGNAGIAVKGVGSGELEAGGKGANLMIKGNFNFDHDFLNPANVMAEYNYTQDIFSISANLGIKEEALPGIKSGNIKILASRDTFEFSGSLIMGGALDGTVLKLSYTPESGITIGGENIPLTPLAKIPGVTSASASIFVNYKPEDELWRVTGEGEVVLGIVGASGDVSVAVDGEYVDLSGSLSISKGPATGTLEFFASNAPAEKTPETTAEQAPQDFDALSSKVDLINLPPPPLKTRGPVQDTMSVWGSGEASIAFGTALTGTAGLALSKKGGVVISGGVSLPPRLKIFDEYKFDKNLLDISLSFPIWSIGIVSIFAELGTTVNFSTFIGPAEIVGANVAVVMDLDNPSSATIKGHGRLEVPAGAGLRLELNGGISAKTFGAGAKGTVGIYGTLGAEALASSDLDIDWSQARGLSIRTDTAINAKASLTFGITGKVYVWAGWWDETYGPWDKELGTIGSGLEIGANLPINWDEATGLNFDISKIAVDEPKISGKQLAKDAFMKVV